MGGVGVEELVQVKGGCFFWEGRQVFGIIVAFWFLFRLLFGGLVRLVRAGQGRANDGGIESL